MSSTKELATSLRNFSIYVLTWNVGSRFPDNITLRQLLGISKEDDSNAKLPDLYAIGLQEVNAQPQHQLRGLLKDDPWTHKAKQLLRSYDYVLFKTEQMQGLLLAMFVKRMHVPYLRNIESEFTRTGFGGMWGNKGAVSVRLSLYGCGLVFVVAHLAAHDHELDERIIDYKQILENHHYHVTDYREIYDHDYVFWFGDLNFRLHGNEAPEEICSSLKAEAGSHESLLKQDQLTSVRESGRAFAELQERLPDFPPTFKFKEGTSTYDHKRRPAWTDRILYGIQPRKPMPNQLLAIEQRHYKAHWPYTISDHKPVSSEFRIKLYGDWRESGVTFTPIEFWTIGVENTVEYMRPLEFEECKHDWIGIFPKGYSSLSDYAAYEYINQAEIASPDTSSEHVFFGGPSPQQHHHHGQRERLRREAQTHCERVRLDFTSEIDLTVGEDYLLIYFQNTSLRGVTTVAGISNTFTARKREKSPA